MRTKKIIVVALVVTFFGCTTDKKSVVTDKAHYQVYLEDSENKKLKAIETDIQFWQSKLDKGPNQYSYLAQIAGLYSQRFEVLGNITDLYHAEKLLLEMDIKNGGESAGIKRSVARNYISQHRFKEALQFINEANTLGENKVANQNMLFDVNMELGNYDEALKNLNSFTDFTDFNYLVRAAKWQDHQGNLGKAISLMERALKKAEESKNQGLQIWIYTNIADFYGHNNEYQKSYDYYLKALQLDNQNYYSLKGIAWIAFSHERNAEKSLEIVNFIIKKHTVPDLYLLKSEIAEFKGDAVLSNQALNQYNQLLIDTNYGDMYNKYNFNLLVNDKQSVNKAMQIAQKEIYNRPTPESYDLLAWSFYKKGDFKKALEIAQKHTIGKSHEPHIAYHIAEILKANNQTDSIDFMKKELLASLYELGPSLESKIKDL